MNSTFYTPLRFFCFLLFLLLSAFAEAEPRFARVFADHAVLQRNVPLRVWGVGADPNLGLILRMGEKDHSAAVEEDGSWSITIPARKASRTPVSLELIENSHHVAEIKELLFGDVWLAAGQSNMQFQVKGMVKGMPSVKSWADSADYPTIRFRRIGDPVLTDRKAEATDIAASNGWVAMTPESVLQFSAVAAAYSRELSDELDVPIGIIDVSWGGKPIEPFIPRESYSANRSMTKIRELADSGDLDTLAKVYGGVVIRNPEGYPSAIFNARIAPITRYGLRGFVWYQGESNAGKGEDPCYYRGKMAALVSGWRERWARKNLPFYFVQLPSFSGAKGWIQLREEQRRALELPDTGMAVTIDIRGDDIHPPDKLPVGERLARLALHHTYKRKEIAPSGPLFREHRVEGKNVRVFFDQMEGGLFIGDRPDAGPVEETTESDLNWFELAGEDAVWHPAVARIDGESVIVSSTEVPVPKEVRYACSVTPQGGNLYNGAKLPASPFCSNLAWLRCHLTKKVLYRRSTSRKRPKESNPYQRFLDSERMKGLPRRL